MDFFFAKLDRLLSSQDVSHSNSASLLAELGTPSTSIAVLDHGDISSHCFSSVGDNSNTLFRACNISKPVTALAAMKLVDQGKFRLEDRLLDLLPEDVMQILTDGATPQRRRMTENITVKQLLSHTSGLSTLDSTGYSVNGDSRAPTTREVLAGKHPAKTLRVQLEGIPGHAFSYSGGGIMVVQFILESITGKDLASLMQETVLGPLKMARSTYRPPPPDENNAAEAYYTGYTKSEAGRRVFPEQAVGGLWTTPADLLKVVRAVQESLSDAENRGFLRQATAQQMVAEVDNCMGLSWFVPHDPGTAFLHGGGNDVGWRCYVVGYAELRGLHRDIPSNCGIAVMTNSSKGAAPLWKIVHAVAYLKNWAEVPRPIGYPAMLPLAVPGVKLDERWRQFIGVWFTGISEISVETDNTGGPVVRFQDTEAIKLVPAAMPKVSYSGESRVEVISALLEGFSMMLRFSGSKADKKLELFNSGNGAITQLIR